MRILVTGANGQLGSTMRIVAQGSNDEYIFTDINDMPGQETVYLDVTDLDSVKETVKRYSIDVIVNCAGYTNVDKAETDQELCHQLNSTAPGNLAAAMKETGGLLVHISSDYVFGGHSYNTPCGEEQKGTPTGVYGLSKLKGEEAIISSGCNYVIIRTAWLHSEFGKNFVKTMLDLTATRLELNVVFDQTGTPTYAHDLAEAILVILQDYADSKKTGKEI
jgi:dTDP-4-dehydrorhamnose reductase